MATQQENLIRIIQAVADETATIKDMLELAKLSGKSKVYKIGKTGVPSGYAVAAEKHFNILIENGLIGDGTGTQTIDDIKWTEFSNHDVISQDKVLAFENTGKTDSDGKTIFQSPWKDKKGNRLPRNFISVNISQMETAMEAAYDSAVDTVTDALQERGFITKGVDLPTYPFGAKFSGTSITRTKKRTRVSGVGGIASVLGNERSGSNPMAWQARHIEGFEGMPEPAIITRALKESINSIESPTKRAALTLASNIPYRPGEVADLMLEDINWETGLVKEWTRGGKTRESIVLNEFLLELLRPLKEQAEIEKRAKSTFGSGTVWERTGTKLFPHTESALNKAFMVEGGFGDKLKDYEDILGRPIKGLKDLRKLVSGIMRDVLPPDQLARVSQMMGHVKDPSVGEVLHSMTSKGGRYAPRVIRPENIANDPSRRALNLITNTHARNLNLPTVNQLNESFNVLSGLWDFENETYVEGTKLEVPKIEDVNQAPETSPTKNEPLTEEQRKQQAAASAENIEDLKLSAAKKESVRLGIEEQNIEKQKKVAALKAEQEARHPTDQMEDLLEKDATKLAVQEAFQDELKRLNEIPEDELTEAQRQRKEAIKKRLSITKTVLTPQEEEENIILGDTAIGELLIEAQTVPTSFSRDLFSDESKKMQEWIRTGKREEPEEIATQEKIPTEDVPGGVGERTLYDALQRQTEDLLKQPKAEQSKAKEPSSKKSPSITPFSKLTKDKRQFTDFTSAVGETKKVLSGKTPTKQRRIKVGGSSRKGIQTIQQQLLLRPKEEELVNPSRRSFLKLRDN